MKNEIPFVKMHGLGNSYIYVNTFSLPIENPEELSQIASDKKFGIGSDGLIMIGYSSIADASMRIFNSDGSEAEMCGNGIRCVGRYVWDHNIINSDSFSIETSSGIKQLQIIHSNNNFIGVKVNMGSFSLDPNDFPIKETDLPSKMIDYPITVNNENLKITCVNVGNPHCIIHTDSITDYQIKTLGPLIENHEMFPKRTNVEFVRVLDYENIQMRVWERGSGETSACGTGAVASSISSIIHGYTGNTVRVHLTGGELEIDYSPDTNQLFMTGPAEYICKGLWYV